jgi:drug/metabolite transporter (DMT)-like permease
MALVVVAALGGALCYAVASALQRQATAAEPSHVSLRPRLLLNLLRRPRWLLGTAGDLAGFGLEFFALSRGPLVVVSPVMVSGLLFALPLGALVDRQQMGRREWRGAVEVVVGLSAFLVVADPASGRRGMSGLTWTVVFLGTLVPSALLVRAAGPRGPRRAIFLATATGLVYGLTAALTKASGHGLDAGVDHLLTRWEPYALLLTGLSSVLLAQSAFHAGPLASSLPVLAVLEPVSGIVIGTLGFGESLSTAGAAPTLEVVALALMGLGVLHLARSELVLGSSSASRASS